MRLVLTLRQSPEYGVDYVRHIVAGVSRYSPDVSINVLTDADDLPSGVTREPLKHDWPGWWSKLELFRPDLRGDFLYIDLDTIVTGPLEPFFSLDRTALLSDLFRPRLAQSGVMYLREDDRRKVWAEIDRIGIGKIMRQYRGDGEFIRHVLPNADRLQDKLPGRIVSYKAHKVEQRGIGDEVSLVCYHGKPRPRDTEWSIGPKR